jgi:putative tryptophan/tyrosine transport system substrate-binding protein
MKRRQFITLLASVAAAWPVVARAQPNRMRRVSVLLGLAEHDPEANARVKAFRLGMRDLEWVEGRNIQIEYRFAGSNVDIIHKHVAELIKTAPDVIVANSTPVMAALKPATTTIPIVFVVVNDPVGQGFIPNLKHPGGNVTGYSFIEPELIGKWINLLSDVKPGLSRVALMFNPDTAPYYDRFIGTYKSSPGHSSVDIRAAHVRSTTDVNSTIAELGREPGVGLIAPGDPYILTARGTILKAARPYGLPVISPYRQFVTEGSLMSYGPDTADIFRRSSSYVDRILKGEAVGNLPAQSPDKFELVINLKTAKALDLSVPAPFLLLADEVIE